MIDTIDNRRLLARLRQMSLFTGLGRAELDAIAAFSTLAHPESGQLLFGRHQPCRSLFHVAGGLVKLTRRVARGREQLLDIAAPGRTLGVTAMFTGAGYPFDAVAMTDTELVVVQARRLWDFVESRPVRLLRLCSELARRHERMVVRVDQLVGRTAAERIALCLLRASHADATDLSVCALFGDLRRADIANMLGVTPETFSRVLSRFRRLGWIEDRNGVPHVLDPDGLVSLLGESPVSPAAAPADSVAPPAVFG